LLDQLGVEKAVIAGLSMGGYVAFELFRRHPHRVTALIFADTRPDPDNPRAREGRAELAQLAREAGSSAVTQQLMPKLLASSTSAKNSQVAEKLRKMMETQDPEAIAGALMAMAERADSRPLLRTIDVPVLVVGGSEDAITPPSDTREWANAIAGARVEFIEQAGHVSNLEQPEAFNKLLLDLLSALPGGITPAKRK
jgi:pimeloyl-ACP methyl ester carboxylesterase